MISARAQHDVVVWLAGRGTGSSSKTMAFWLGFGVRCEQPSHPWDPADFDRCLGLLAAVPELRASLGAMRGISNTWHRLIDHWDEIEASHLDEVGLGWTKANSAPKTYQLMSQVIDEVDRRKRT